MRIEGLLRISSGIPLEEGRRKGESARGEYNRNTFYICMKITMKSTKIVKREGREGR
jgi:hypothetical protein